MKKILLLAICSAIALSVDAQDTYQSATLTDQDLNGTARYVGMGGAMEALGADISTISTNPAGVAMFRKSQVTATFGINNVSGYDALNGSRTNASFDQAGIVLTTLDDDNTRINLAFNYSKSKNFNSLLNVSNVLNNAAQNKLSCLKWYDGDYDLDNDMNYSQVDYLYNTMLNGIVSPKGDIVESFAEWYNANGYNLQRVETGYTSAFDMGISGNINDVFYLGLTVGVKDIHYTNSTVYCETLLAADDVTPLGTVTLDDERTVTGTGVDIKFGAILRPVSDSPFRLGAYVHSPTWYTLKTSNNTILINGLPKGQGNYDKCYSDEFIEFKVYTPWHFGASVGHTFGNFLAFGATYDYADYSTMDNRAITGHDSYGDTYSRSDYAMNSQTEKSLKGVHTVKVGTEIKLHPQLALRAGYNYLSPKYSESAERNTRILSQGTYISSTTDFVNWDATNRITCGLGYTSGSFTLDLAYQYSATDGKFKPFQSDYYSATDKLNNVCQSVNVSNKRNQVLLTMGYRF